MHTASYFLIFVLYVFTGCTINTVQEDPGVSSTENVENLCLEADGLAVECTGDRQELVIELDSDGCVTHYYCECTRYEEYMYMDCDAGQYHIDKEVDSLYEGDKLYTCVIDPYCRPIEDTCENEPYDPICGMAQGVFDETVMLFANDCQMALGSAYSIHSRICGTADCSYYSTALDAEDADTLAIGIQYSDFGCEVLPINESIPSATLYLLPVEEDGEIVTVDVSVRNDHITLPDEMAIIVGQRYIVSVEGKYSETEVITGYTLPAILKPLPESDSTVVAVRVQTTGVTEECWTLYDYYYPIESPFVLIQFQDSSVVEIPIDRAGFATLPPILNDVLSYSTSADAPRCNSSTGKRDPYRPSAGFPIIETGQLIGNTLYFTVEPEWYEEDTE